MANEPNKPVSQYDVQPGKYYIWKFDSLWPFQMYIYKPVWIFRVYEAPGDIGIGTRRKAEYFDPETYEYNRLTLDDNNLYEIPVQS